MRGNRGFALVVTKQVLDVTDTCPLNQSTLTKSVLDAGDLSITCPEIGFAQELTGAFNVKHGQTHNGTCTRRVINTQTVKDGLQAQNQVKVLTLVL